MKYKTYNNNVLIEIDIDTQTGSGLMMDLTFNPENVPRFGKVVSVPVNLIYGKNIDGMIDQDHNNEWDTNINIKEGDIVYFDYLMAIKMLGWKLRDILDQYNDNGQWVIIDDKLHIFLEYDSLYLRIRGKEIKTLNGYMIIKPISNNNMFMMEQENNMREGICKFSGEPNKEYYEDHKHTIMPKVGERVIFMDFANIRLDPQYYNGLFDEELWVTQSYRLLGIIKL